MTNTLIALREKNQRLLNRAYNADRAYHDLVNMQALHCDDDNAEYYNRQEEKLFNKACELWERLPKVELSHALKQYKKIHGYC